MAILHKNFAQTTLAAAITDTTGTSITVTSETSFPAVQFIISVDTEAMLVTAVAGTTWTVTRGYEGSMAATHLNGAAIYHDWSAGEADSAVHGPASAVDAHLAVFDSTTGKLIKDGGAGVAGVWLEEDVNGDLMPGTTQLSTLIVSATDKVLGRASAGAGGVEEISCTPAGRAILDDANAAAQLTTLGAAASASITNVDNTSDATKNAATVTVTNHRFTRRVDTQATTDTITPEISTYDIFIRTAQAHALVINNHSSSTPVDGDMMLFEILSDATIRAITYGNKYVAKAGVALPAATVASKNLTMLFIWRVDLSQWVLLSAGQGA